VLLAVLVSVNAPWRLSRKVMYIPSTLMLASTAALARLLARTRLSLRHKSF
jgi:hypothetical protein